MLRSYCNAIGRKRPGRGRCSCGGCLLLIVLAVPASAVGQSDAAELGLGKPQFSARSFEMIPMSSGSDDFRTFRLSDLRTPPALELSRAPALPSLTIQFLPGSPIDPSDATSPGPGDFRTFRRSYLRSPSPLEFSPELAPPSFAFQSLPSPPADPLGAWRRRKLPQFVLKSPLFSNALMRGTLKEAVGQDLFRLRSEDRSRRIRFGPYMNFRRGAVGMRLNLRLSAHP